MKKLIVFAFIAIAVSVTATVKEKKVINEYAWTSDCKCVKVSPTFAQYVPVSNCKGVSNSFGCK
jgi:hypothetical protein